MDLRELFTELRSQHFDPELPHPVLAWNSRMSSTAGRFHPCASDDESPLIEVASYLRELPDGPKHIRDTMLHEMIHYQLWWQRKPYGHTAEFYEMLKKTGALRFNPVPKERAVKYWYSCPSCKVRVPARRKLGHVACATCCKTFNRGRFSAAFLLRMSEGDGSECSEPLAEETKAYLEPEDFMRRLQELKNLVKNSVIRKL